MTIKDTTSRWWGIFRGFPLLVQGVLAVVMLFVLFIVASSFSSTVRGWRNHITAYLFDIKDTADVNEINLEKQKTADAEARAAENAKSAAEFKLKYEIAIHTFELDGKKGAKIDNDISQQVEVLNATRSQPMPTDVPDDVLLRALRESQGKAAPTHTAGKAGTR